ncbi:hypothetical protein CEQ90_05335 [Lewinellaceae bacterium SD302]|nr:hypothetical protein CEQ90_05335 [Lewinellaceae bacterium SD302]
MTAKILYSFTIICVLLSTNNLVAQETEVEPWSPGEYMRQATDNVFEKASLMNALSEFSFSDELCLAGAILEVGATIALDVELKKGEAYTLIGGGDDDVVDLDLYVVDNNGEIVASDIEDDNTPIPDFTAAYTGRYSIRMQLISGQAPTSFVSLALLTTSGESITEEEFGKISTAFFEGGETLHQVSSGVKWHDLTNQWCLLGASLNDGQSWSMENLHLGDGEHYLYASGSDNSDNIDLSLKNVDGIISAVDEEPDEFPIMELNSSNSERYELTVTNTKSNGRSFIMIGILTE